MKSRPNQTQPWRRMAACSLLLAACALLLAGCNLAQPQADNVRYFTLDSPAGAAPVASATRVRPVHLAGHLHGRLMAVRVAEHEVIYLEDFRWAEPLDDSITRLLRDRLEAVGGGATVSVLVERFELVRSEGNSVQLVASYSIVPADGDKASPQRGTFTSSRRVWDGKGYAGLVALLHDSVAELGEAIAAAVPAAK